VGKVRIKIVKRMARKLLELYPDAFTEDFQHNKQIVAIAVNVASKKLRNQIAGYVTHLVKLRRRQLRAVKQTEAAAATTEVAE